jgi:hypothetical protein
MTYAQPSGWINWGCLLALLASLGWAARHAVLAWGAPTARSEPGSRRRRLRWTGTGSGWCFS